MAVGFSIFLFLCAVINFAAGHIGAAISSLGEGGFFWLSAACKEIEDGEGNKQ